VSDLKQLPPAGDTPRKVADVVNEAVKAINYGQLQPRTVAELAAESQVAGRMFLCTNETGGAVPVFCDVDGGDWRRVTDRAVAS
jgi:hypothetical protein